MIKTFYKKRQPRKVFFKGNIRIRSHAYGYDINDEFLAWRKSFTERWNKPSGNFLTMERGDMGGNNAKIDRASELRVNEPRNKRTVERSEYRLSPLWVEGLYMELHKDGSLFINDERTEISLGAEMKAWGIMPLWKGNYVEYTLFTVGKSRDGVMRLTARRLDAEKGPEQKEILSVELESTLAKSHIYCFGKHIILVHQSKLQYYYYNEERVRLEEVAIRYDEHNDVKNFCNKVSANVVCDSNGNIYWHTNDCVYGFTIGYPNKLHRIFADERSEIIRIQAFKNGLYVYERNKTTRECACKVHTSYSNGEIKEEVFNYGAAYNLFYGDKNGILFYLKVPELSARAYTARYNAGKETVASEINIGSADRMFCVDGDLYLGFDYIGDKPKNK